ncbi:MAG: BON domain-containing protein [Azonexus sp.]|nr:BON domain-containing protein [Azonexus sp.]
MINRNLAITGIVLATMLGSLGLSAFATDNPQTIAALGATVEAPDGVLHDKVETLLRTDVGLVGSQFRVLSKSGVITLGGTVPDEHSLRRALDLASSVRGVREVRNAMEIDSPK